MELVWLCVLTPIMMIFDYFSDRNLAEHASAMEYKYQIGMTNAHSDYWRFFYGHSSEIGGLMVISFSIILLIFAGSYY